MKLKVQSIRDETFAPFGRIVGAPETEPTVRLEGMDYWAGITSLPDLEGGYSVGYATQAKRPFVQASAERHLRTPELLMPVGGDMVVVVGPADHMGEPERLPDPDRFAAFSVPEGEAVIFGPGVWHWAPFAVDETIRLLVIYAAGTAEGDAVVVDLPPEAVLELEF
jgi:ureidoglycolate lyase